MPEFEVGEVVGERVSDPPGIIIRRADKHVLFDDYFLADADERYVSIGDGIVTFHGRDGDVSYGLSHYDNARRQWLGTRSD